MMQSNLAMPDRISTLAQAAEPKCELAVAKVLAKKLNKQKSYIARSNSEHDQLPRPKRKKDEGRGREEEEGEKKEEEEDDDSSPSSTSSVAVAEEGAKSYIRKRNAELATLTSDAAQLVKN